MSALESLFNPIFRRELQQRSRSWQSLAAVLSVAIGAIVLVLLRWPTDQRVDLVSQAASLVFRPLAFALTLAVMMLVPAFPATSLVTERRRATLSLLLNSPCKPWQIYAAKLFGNIFIAWWMIAAALPTIAACYAMGGISIGDQIVPLLVILSVSCVLYTAIGLWISSRASSAETSLRWTYATVVLMFLLSVGPLVFTGQLANWKAQVATALSTISPLSSILEITGSEATASAIGLTTGWKEFSLVSLLIAVIIAALTIWQIHPTRMDRSRPAGKIVDSQKTSFVTRVARRFMFLIDPSKRKTAIPRLVNPIMVKEFRTRKFGRLHWLIRIVAFCIVTSLAMTILAATGTVSWGVEQIAIALVLMQICLLMLVGPSLGSSLIAGEVESGGWTLLRATPFSSLRILTGKLSSVLLTLMMVLLATIPGYLVMGYIQPTLSGQISNVFLSLLMAVILIVSVSACVSVFCRSTAVATVASYSILLLIFAGTMLFWLARGKPFGPLLVERILLLNPVAVALSEMEAPGFSQYNLAPMGWYVSAAISILCLSCMAFKTWRMMKPD
jgi:ABC-type transport system involved in multi-copper enzyme maturation permease subunit